MWGQKSYVLQPSPKSRASEHEPLGRRRWGCSSCSFVTSTSEEMVAAHARRLHPGARGIGCQSSPDCPFSAIHLAELDSHRAREHRGDEDPEMEDMPELAPPVHYFVRKEEVSREDESADVNNNCFPIEESVHDHCLPQGGIKNSEHDYCLPDGGAPQSSYEIVPLRDSKVGIEPLDVRALTCVLCRQRFCGPGQLLCHLFGGRAAGHGRAGRGGRPSALRIKQERRCRGMLESLGEPFRCSDCERSGTEFVSLAFKDFTRHVRTEHFLKSIAEGAEGPARPSPKGTVQENDNKEDTRQKEIPGERGQGRVLGIKKASLELRDKLRAMRARREERRRREDSARESEKVSWELVTEDMSYYLN